MDFSSVSYIDPSGVSMLKSVIESFQKLDIPVYIAACSGEQKMKQIFQLNQIKPIRFI